MSATDFWVLLRVKLSSTSSILYAGNILRIQGAASFEYFRVIRAQRHKYCPSIQTRIPKQQISSFP